MSMSYEVETAFLAGKDAASKEREDRLENARKKLKKYRARQSKSSMGSTGSSISSRRDSTLSTSQLVQDTPALGHRHRRSVSKASISGLSGLSSAPKGHGRKASKSRGSRGGSLGGHGHTRSRASISISISGPPPTSGIPASFQPLHEDVLDRTKAPLGAPASWGSNGSFPSSPELGTVTTPMPTSSASEGSRHASNLSNAMASSSNHTSQASLSATGPPPSHSRRPSRHNRRSSVANFRESMEIVSGGVFDSTLLQPSVGSFTATSSAESPPSPSNSTRSVSPGFPTDPARVLEALKERGRRESESELDAEGTRQGALEALEGRLSAPSQMIDLGSQANGELLVAPPSPGYTSGVPSPSSPSAPAFASPMIGLGLSGKRNSWSAPVTAAGAKGAMDLGVLAEEDEDEEENEKEDVPALPSPKRRGASPRKRPTSLSLPPASVSNVVAFGSPNEEAPPSFAARPMQLSLSLSSNSSTGTPTPTTAASPLSSSQRPPALRSFTLGSLPTSLSSEGVTDEPRSYSPSSPPNERRRHSLFHSVAAVNANAFSSPTRTPSQPSVAAPRGLRSLSIGGLGSQHSMSSPPQSSPDSLRSSASRRAASTSTAGPKTAPKRSSISYRNTSMSSLNSPEGPLSAAAQAARRPWRTASASSSVSTNHSASTAPTPSSTLAGYPFPFAPSHGSFGGFGDLEVEESEEEGSSGNLQRLSYASTSLASDADDSTVLVMQIAALRSQIEQLKSQTSHLTSTHALEIAEFEKKAGEEARSMRMRIAELERQLEEGRVGRRFEVEGLSRENEQAREAVADLTEERDSLREDVDGWRTRCSKLEQVVKREREDDSLASAQAKLIGEMRDQIYNLVAALERERGEHAETRQEVDRLYNQQSASSSQGDEEDDEDGHSEEAGLGIRIEGGRRHGAQTASDGSILSSFGRSYSGNTTEDTSIATDIEDSSKVSSPSSGHSSFGQAIGFPAGSKRDSELVNTALHTLTEEDEDEEDFAKEGERTRQGSVSTGSTDVSDAMPQTPNKDVPAHHNRSDSFVRHWSFPKGSVSSVRISLDDDHSFFDLGRHASLPALPITDSVLPPFLEADLTVDEEQYAYFPPPKQQQHFRRPSSPRPSERMVPHSRKYSGQFAPKPPPILPSALAHGTIASQSSGTSSSRSLGRFGSLIGSFGGWSPASSVTGVPPASQRSKAPFSSELALDENTDGFMASTRHQTPASLLHSSRAKQRYIKAAQQPVPRASRLAILDFTPVCCSAEDIVFV